METIRQAGYAADFIERAIAENADIGSRITEEIALEKKLRGSAPPMAPERIAHYHIRGELAHGGMGRIYKGWDSELYRDVAIKTIRRDAHSTDYKRRFLREQRILARLHETRIIPIFEAGTFEHAGRTEMYYVMPLIDGAVSLGDVLTCARLAAGVSETPRLSDLVSRARTGADLTYSGNTVAEATATTLPPMTAPSPGSKAPSPEAPFPRAPDPEARAHRRKAVRHSESYLRSVANVVAEIGVALDFAHSRGILHRDCKPANVLITPSEEVFVLDFGLACAVEARQGSAAKLPHDLGNRDLTHVFTEGSGGTPEYMSPEQFAGKATVQSDVWSLGATLYELLTFEKPFGSDRNRLEEFVASRPPLSMAGFAENLPDDLKAICLKALEKNTAQRYASAAELAEDLRKWLNGFPTAARPAGVPRRLALWSRRNPGWAATIILAVVFAIVGGAMQINAANRDRIAALARSLQSKRDSLLQSLQRIRLTPHRSSWSRETLRIAVEAAELGRDEVLRDQMLACLAGMDVTPMKAWDFGASSVAISSDGDRVVMGGNTDSSVKIWTKIGDQLESPLSVGPGPVCFLSAGDDALAATVEDPWHFALWSVSQKRVTARFEVPSPAEIEKPTDEKQIRHLLENVVMVISHDGSLLGASAPVPDAAGQWSAESAATFIWNARGEIVRRLEGQASALCFSPDDSLLAVGHEDGTIAVVSPADGKILATLGRGGSQIHCLDFRENPVRDGDMRRWLLAAGDAGGTVTVWDLTTQQPQSFCRGSHYDIFAVKFSPDGMTLASGGRGAARLWDFATGTELLKIQHTGDYINGLAYSADGRQLAISAQRGVTLWALDYGRGIDVLRGMSSQVVKTCQSPDGKVILAQGQNWDIGVFDVSPRRLRYVVAGPRGYTADNSALAIGPDGTFAATAGSEARFFRLDTGALTGRQMLPPGIVDNLAYSPEGALISVRMECADGKTAPMSNAHPKEFPRVLRVRNLRAQDPDRPLQEFTRFNWHVFCAMIDPLGRFIVADGLHNGTDGNAAEIIVYDTTTGKKMWRRTRVKTNYGPFMAIDAVGSTVACSDDQNLKSDIVRLPFGQPHGESTPLALALSSRGAFTLTNGDKVFDSSDTLGLALRRQPDGEIILKLGIDFQPHNTSTTFALDDDLLVFGTMEGHVVICDLPEIDRRLRDLGFPGLENRGGGAN
jgi:serine/threonine protein kinase/WD40 repeat protein